MEELTIEQKAQRYDEALVWMQDLYPTMEGAMKEDAKHYFPQLKENKSEKIRKMLVRFFSNEAEYNGSTYGIPDKDIVAWLEKQGGITKLSEEEQNRFAKGVLSNCAMSFIDYLDAHNCEGKMCVSNGDCADIENAFHNDMWDKLHRYYCKYIEKQNEQNHANSTKTCNIEPKFKAGDKIIGIVSGIPYYITKVCNDHYFTETGCCIMFNAQNNFKLYEQKPVDSYCQENCKGFKETGKCFADEDYKAKREAESINKVEPKFHEKDWIVNKDGRIFQIMRIDNDFNHITYACRFIEQDTKDWVSYSEDDISLWDISNAKNGDVLASNSSTFLFSQEYIAGKPEAHCGIMNGFFIVKPEGCWTNEKIYPATKEQRYALFAKIREAGYKWDAEKKELKKIKQGNSPVLSNSSNIGKDEQKSTDKIKPTVHNYITPNKQFFQWIYDRLINVHNENPNVDYMLSLKERIKDMQKPAWSKEDEDYYDAIIAKLEVTQEDAALTDNQMNFLKFLKDRVKPKQEWSEEDEKIVAGLNNCIDELEEANGWRFTYVNDENVELCKIRNWLKSLKERVACEANCTTTKQRSEDEESIINKAESWLDTLCDYLKDSSPEYISDIKDVINKLKSIKGRYTWKPSSIQMECLHDAVEHYHTNGYPATKLTELYEQISKIYNYESKRINDW